MINLDKNIENSVSIYLNIGSVNILFTNQTSLQKFEINNLANISTSSNFSTFIISKNLLTNYPIGLYDYLIKDSSNNILEKGICQIIDSDNNDIITYIEYDPELNFIYYNMNAQ